MVALGSSCLLSPTKAQWDFLRGVPKVEGSNLARALLDKTGERSKELFRRKSRKRTGSNSILNKTEGLRRLGNELAVSSRLGRDHLESTLSDRDRKGAQVNEEHRHTKIQKRDLLPLGTQDMLQNHGARCNNLERTQQLLCIVVHVPALGTRTVTNA